MLCRQQDLLSINCTVGGTEDLDVAVSAQVQEGRAGTLPLRLLTSVSRNVLPLLTEWRKRIRNVSRGRTPGLYVPSTAATLGMFSDTDYNEAAARGLGEPGVSHVMAGIRGRASGAAVPAGPARGTSMQVQRTPGEGGVMLHVTLAQPAGASTHAATLTANVQHTAAAGGSATRAALHDAGLAAGEAAQAAQRSMQGVACKRGLGLRAAAPSRRTMDVNVEVEQQENITCDGMVPGLPAAARAVPKGAWGMRTGFEDTEDDLCACRSKRNACWP